MTDFQFDVPSHKFLGEHILEMGACNTSHIDQALKLQQQNGGLFGSILVSHGIITNKDLALALSAQQALPYVNLLEGPTFEGQDHNNELLGLMPDSFWWSHQMLPLSIEGSVLKIAAVDATLPKISELQAVTGYNIEIFVTGYRDLCAALVRRYSIDIDNRSCSALSMTRPKESAHLIMFRH